VVYGIRQRASNSSTPTISLRTESKGSSAVISGATMNSTAFLETKGAISGWELNSWIEASRRTETRARYPAFKVSTRTANPMKPVAPVIWKGLLVFDSIWEGSKGELQR
jgi:hypothetical protein